MKSLVVGILVFTVITSLAYWGKTRQGPASPQAGFRCEGKIYCSQMTSCNEALFYLKNCPGVKIDGDGDKIPCEKEWCGPSRSAANHF